MSMEQQKKSRRSMMLLLLVFALPVILAKLALELQWFDYGVTNQGELVPNEITLEKLGIEKESVEEGWLLLYTMPKQCDAHCEQLLDSVNNTYIALGREMPRVKAVALNQVALSAEQLKVAESQKWQFLAMPEATKAIFTSPQILIVDPLGNVVLTHLPPENPEHLSMFGKSILADFKKLLKYSRVG